MPPSLRAFAPAIVWAAVVWTIGGLDSVPGVPVVPHIDKAGHFAMYGVLGFLAGRGWIAAGTRAGQWWPILLVLAMAAADEYRQSLSATRSAEFADWVADTAGAGCGFFLALRNARGRCNDESSDERK